jgi:hypothetical protein
MNPPDSLKRSVAALMQALEAMDYFCAGTLFTRTKVCGKASCRCAADPSYRHGPYFTWVHMYQNRSTQHALTAEQAQLARRAIANSRTIRRLLAKWNRESTAVILGMNSRKS